MKNYSYPIEYTILARLQNAEFRRKNVHTGLKLAKQVEDRHFIRQNYRSYKREGVDGSTKTWEGL